jgi:glycosyltransferase involved in cell wall biosynthesis
MRTPIFINGRFLTQRTTGVQRYALETLLAMDDLLASGQAPELKVTLLAPRGARAPRLKSVAFRTLGGFSGNAWEQVTLPLATHDAWLLSFGPTGPIGKTKQVVTMHDAAVYAVPHAFNVRFRSWYKLLMPALARRLPALMTVSEFSKSELVRYCGADTARVRVAGGSGQHVLRVSPDPDVLARHGLAAGRYVLAVSSVTPHKNFGVIVDAARHLADAKLTVAVAGAVNHDVFGRTELGAHERLKLLGYVDDAQLVSLYENAAAFIFPSLYEGFGLPPLEAMALRCPVIAASAASMPEVCGDAALYFAPRDAAALARAIERVVADAALREQLVEKGVARARRFSWTECARKHLALLAHLTDTPARGVAGQARHESASNA